MKVADIHTCASKINTLYTIRPWRPLAKAAGYGREEDIGSLVVMGVATWSAC
jgi:hypothetical protein